MKGVENDLPHAWILNGFDQLLSDFQSWKAGKERDALLYASDDSNMVDEALPDNEPHRKYSPEEWETLVEVGRKKHAEGLKKSRIQRLKREAQILEFREVFAGVRYTDVPDDAKHEVAQYFKGAVHRAVRGVFDCHQYFSLEPKDFAAFVGNFAKLEIEDRGVFRELLVKLQVYNNALMALDKDWVNSEGDIYPFTTE